jgi:Zn finger protein HypA/HybF involved in hydrogenase expression
MKKRANVKVGAAQPVVPPELLETAKMAVADPKPRKTFRCRVCGSEGATEQSEMLCWVCRRLKISAWREIEQQVPMSE